jgi:hypothetical protein
MSYGDFYFMRISTVNDDSDDLFPSPLYKCCDWKMRLKLISLESDLFLFENNRIKRRIKRI